MIIPPLINQKFDELLPYLDEVGKRVEDAVFAYCKAEGYAYSARHKHRRSLTEKIESGRFDKWENIDDLFACSIIIPTLIKERHVVDFLRTEFQSIDVKWRGATNKDPQVFRFDSTRFIGTLRNISDLNSPLATIRFEIQIRSAFEHAWSTTTHSLVYKGGDVEWSKIRLAAQLKAAVEQLDLLILGFEDASKHIGDSKWTDIEVLKLIKQCFEDLSDIIPSEAKPNSWNKFSENVYSLAKHAKSFNKFNALETVREFLLQISAGIREFSLDSFPRSVSLFQVVLGLAAQKELIKNPLHRYHVFATPQLIDLFPRVGILSPVFII